MAITARTLIVTVLPTLLVLLALSQLASGQYTGQCFNDKQCGHFKARCFKGSCEYDATSGENRCAYKIKTDKKHYVPFWHDDDDDDDHHSKWIQIIEDWIRIIFGRLRRHGIGFKRCCNRDSDCPIQGPCTYSKCNVFTGQCEFGELVCRDDGNPCTREYCNYKGKCVSAKQCISPDLCDCCVWNSECDDQDPCTDDKCIMGGCVNTPKDCDDGNDCTVDFCNAAGGCEHIRNPLCCNTNAECDDKSDCTMDYCRGHRCHHQRTCPCSTGSQCDTTDICLNSACASSQCRYTNITDCCYIHSDCDDKNPCTLDTCIDNQCDHVPKCDDGDLCTKDVCNPADGKCTNTVIRVCDDKKFCTDNICTETSCDYAPQSCDDGNPCTVDSCDEAGKKCIHTPLSCNDGLKCTDDYCNPFAVGDASPCFHVQKDCNDNNLCTIDSCVASTGECKHTAKQITCPNDACGATQCNPRTGQCGNHCQNPLTLCVDGTCNANTGKCTYFPYVCNDGNPCTVDLCDNRTGCAVTKKPCADAVPCTIDKCVINPTTSNPECKHYTRDCADSDLCTIDKGCELTTGVCLFDPVEDKTECLDPESTNLDRQEEEAEDGETSSSRRSGIIAAAVLVPLFTLAGIGICVALFVHRRSSKRKDQHQNLPEVDESPDSKRGTLEPSGNDTIHVDNADANADNSNAASSGFGLGGLLAASTAGVAGLWGKMFGGSTDEKQRRDSTVDLLHDGKEDKSPSPQATYSPASSKKHHKQMMSELSGNSTFRKNSKKNLNDNNNGNGNGNESKKDSVNGFDRNSKNQEMEAADAEQPLESESQPGTMKKKVQFSESSQQRWQQLLSLGASSKKGQPSKPESTTNLD